MTTHKHIDKICCVVIIFAVILTLIFMNGKLFGIKASAQSKEYESRLFDTSKVHTLDIEMEDWDSFIETCTNEEYTACNVTIDGETFENVAIRAKGNTSLTQVANYNNDRYSFKVEFNHYSDALSYYGLDKLNLNNIIQDNTYMKDYLTYQLMRKMDVSAPLCSYVNITVNGENKGLYLAIEGVEDSFLERNYGSDYGDLYKPDSSANGGGRGNGAGFDMDKWEAPDGENNEQQSNGDNNAGQMPQGGQQGDMQQGGSPPEMPEGGQPDDMQQGGNPPEMPEGAQQGGQQGGPQQGGQQGGMGSDDVKLIYSDDNISSYSNIFDNAKTKVSKADKKRLIASLKKLNAQEDIESVVDTDAVIRYFVVHNFVCNFDSYTGDMIHNYYLYEKDGQMSMIPWDYNLAFGGFVGGADATSLVNYSIDNPVSGGTVESRPMLSWIFSNSKYTTLYHSYFAEFLETCYASGYMENEIESTRQLIQQYVQDDPTKFCTYDEFQTGVDTLKVFCKLRSQAIMLQLSGSSETVDASSINISSMGSMGGGGGAGGAQGAPQGDAQGNPQGDQQGGPQGQQQGGQPPEGMQGDQQGGPQGGQPPGGMNMPNA